MKNFLIKIVILFGKILGPIFYKKKFLRGKYFDLKDPAFGWHGWLWVLEGIWIQKILGFNRRFPVPMHHTFKLGSFENLHMHHDNMANFQSPGCYFQNPDAHIKIGRGTIVAPNVCIITRNHNFKDFDKYEESKPVEIGRNCWIAANAVILPGVTIGDNVIVAAGAIVTKSFGDSCVIGGNPAKVIKDI